MDDWPPKRVKVIGREDIGDVIQWGKNVGASPAIYCAVIYFQETGECVFYDVRRLIRVE